MIIEPILRRRAVKKYSSKPVNDPDILEIIRAGQYAPTSHHNASVEFIVIKDASTKEQLFTLLGQEFLKEAPVIIVPIIDSAKTHFPVQDLSVASENIFVQAASMGLGTVWKNVGEEFAAGVKTILSAPETHVIINLIPVGYPAEEVLPHTEKEYSEKKIHREHW